MPVHDNHIDPSIKSDSCLLFSGSKNYVLAVKSASIHSATLDTEPLSKGDNDGKTSFVLKPEVCLREGQWVRGLIVNYN